MHEDKQGNLWLVTGGGLVKFVASAEQIQYSSEHIAFNMHFSEGVGATLLLKKVDERSILILKVRMKFIWLLWNRNWIFCRI